MHTAEGTTNMKSLVYLDNASSGMNAVLRSLQWKAGDILFIIGSVYAVFTNVAAWLSAHLGVHVVHVSSRECTSLRIIGMAD